MATTLNVEQVRSVLSAACQAIYDAREALSDADRQIGDGDHGVGMGRGFKAAPRIGTPGEYVFERAFVEK